MWQQQRMHHLFLQPAQACLGWNHLPILIVHAMCPGFLKLLNMYSGVHSVKVMMHAMLH